MNEKLRLAALFSAGIIAGAVPLRIAQALDTPAPHHLEIINMKLVKSTQPDGGVAWSARTCAYETAPDAGRVAEPCWQAMVPGNLIAPVERTLLDQKK